MSTTENKGIKSLLAYFRKHALRGGFETLFAIIVCVEIVFISVLLIADIVRPKGEFEYAASNFYSEDLSNVNLEGSYLVFSPAEGISEDNYLPVVSDSFSLNAGAYQFYISYDSDTGSNGDFTQSTGTVIVKSEQSDVESDIAKLDDGHSQIVGKFWIPVLSRCDDLHIVVRYNGQGTLRINSISIVESRRYRVIRFIGFLALFMLIDALFVVFFTDFLTRLNKTVVAMIMIILAACIPFADNYVSKGDDLLFHMVRIASIAQGLSDGQFPVRIATELNNGYGYANSLYYCDIFLYLSAILYKFMVPLRICYKIYVLMVNAFTGLFTYFAMSKFTKRQDLRVLGTMLYMLCTYRLVNIYARAAVGEYTAMCFLPLIVLGLHNILQKKDIKTSDWFPLAAGMSGVIMSHVVTAEMLVINIALLCVLSLTRLLNVKRILAMLKSVGLSVMLTAWFLVPFVDSVIHQTTIVQKGDLRMLGTTAQSWFSLFEIFAPGHDNGNWISLGLPFVVGIILLLYCLYSWKNDKEAVERDPDRSSEFRMLCLLSFVNVFFVSKSFPWNRIQNWLGRDKLGYQLGTIQFAWRFLTISAVLLSFAVVMALDFISENRSYLYKAATIVMAASIILNCGFFYFGYYDYAEDMKYSSVSEYSATDRLYHLNGTNLSVRNISQCSITEGSADISGYSKQRGVTTLNVKNLSGDQEAGISVPIYAYDHYHVYELHDGAVTGELTYDKDDRNCILIRVPGGFDGKVQIRFREPVLWRITEIISLITWIIAFYMMLSKLRPGAKEHA